MTSVQIPFIEFTNNRIQKSSIIIDNNQFNVEFKDNKYIVTKGNTMSETSSPAQQTDMKSSPAPTVAKNANEKPKKMESTKSAAQTSDNIETQKTDTGPEPKPLKNRPNIKKEPIKRKLTDKEIMMQDLFKAIALRRKTVDERDKREKVQEEGDKGEKVQKDKEEEKKEEAKPTESKYKTYNTMKKTGLPEGAVRQKMIRDGIEKKKIDDYFDSQEYKDIKPST